MAEHFETDEKGKYDALCTYVREQANADAVAVIVMGGAKGSGFSVQAVSEDFARHQLPDLLEAMAKNIRAQNVQYMKARPDGGVH